MGPLSALAFERYDPTDASIAWLRERGLEVRMGHPLWVTPFTRYSEDELIAAAQDCVALMGASGTRISRRVIEALPKLRYISKYGIGFDSIDIEAATEHGVLVSNTPNEYQWFTVSEHAIAMMLALAKQFSTWTPEFMRAGGWRGLTHSAILRGATVGIVGLGRIGRGVAQRLVGWEVRLLGYDPHIAEAPPGVELAPLNALIAQADFLTLHAAPSADNRHLMNRAAFAAMKPTAYVVNTGRGSLIDYAALREALASGEIAGAALDVFDQEPPRPDDPLFAMPNVICTPHVAAWTKPGTEGIGWHAARNLWAMISGEGPVDLVNPEAKARGRAVAR
ncbi:MAG: hydroxyacid dehydrogenase [Pseudomonadota bacterium]|nr:hydroxyacid dehydrogenase [Pseudomonadota bacterium]